MNLFIAPTVVLGKLTVIREVTVDQLPATTPLSYRSQGVLFECQCECGELVYYPEKVLSLQKVKSCGCIRRANLQRGKIRHAASSKADLVRQRIKILQKEHRTLVARDKLHEKPEIGEQLKTLFAELKKLGFSR